MSPLPYTIGSLLCLVNAVLWPTIHTTVPGLVAALGWIAAAWFCRRLYQWTIA